MNDIEWIDSCIEDLEQGDHLFLYSLEPVLGLLHEIKIIMIHRDMCRFRVALSGKLEEERRVMIYADEVRLKEVKTESGDWIRIDCIVPGSIVARAEFKILYRAKIERSNGEEKSLYEYDGNLEIGSILESDE